MQLQPPSKCMTPTTLKVAFIDDGLDAVLTPGGFRRVWVVCSGNQQPIQEIDRKRQKCRCGMCGCVVVGRVVCAILDHTVQKQRERERKEEQREDLGNRY
jgi:hypothetical protein